MPMIVVRNGKDYTCQVETLPARDGEVFLDLVARDGEVRDTGRFTVRHVFDKRVEGQIVPLFRLSGNLGKVPKGTTTLVATELRE